MKTVLTKAALSMALALSVCAPAAYAKSKKPKHSAEHVAAVKKCEADYKAAVKDDRMKKGKERKDAEAQAKQSEKQCIAAAPQ